METFNYFYNNTPITKEQFISNVPKFWELEIVDGVYSWGYYKAIEIETN